MDVMFTGRGWPGPPWERRKFRARFDPPWGRGRWRMGRGPWGPWGPSGPRARRGDVRVAVLALLAERPMHGYQVIQELEGRTGGAWRVSPGSVYPTLQLLEDEGLIAGQEVEGRRVYSLTEAGRARVEAMRQDGQAAPWEEVAAEDEEPFGGLRRAAFQLAAAAMQVAHAGSKEQVERTVAILDEARRKIYAILAEDGQG
ncbi:MAG TPA: PadR family transcriptional regulator [Candidatus Dormibacteraeota bacterium]|jgi:DNA-binding PadR family transcriptional regulator|nr:PadR family transcriptional regulator [Candidatus Dormibacteraeota bacterium]